LGLGDKFEEIKKCYAEVNQMFGDVIKVTPSSKVVGDMAQYMVSNGLTVQDVMEKGEAISFPESVQSYFRGDLGQPTGGFPKKLQKLVLKNQKPYTNRPNSHLAPVDFKNELAAFRLKFQKGFGRRLQMTDFLSWKLYPKVWEDAYAMHLEYDDVSKIPTLNFLYGLKPHEETLIEIAPGKTIIIELLSIGPPNEDGMRTIFFKLNGQTRNVEIADKQLAIEKVENVKADPNDDEQIGAPLQGLLSQVMVKNGQKIKKNEPLFIIEAMKMETTVTASASATVKKITLKAGVMVHTDDLVLTIVY